MDGLNLTIIKGLKFGLPPLELQKEFVQFFKQVDKSKVAVQKALEETQTLFNSLMQEYFG
jgi:restriction endonuclease S subunit